MGEKNLTEVNKHVRLYKTFFKEKTGENIVASMYGANDMLENQVTAMKNLIRSKKEEIT